MCRSHAGKWGQVWYKSAVEDVPWYSEATLFTDTRLRRAGTLIQCVRKWRLLSATEQPGAHIKLSVMVDSLQRLDAGQIAGLMTRSGYLNA
jgi:hypothetical protein